MIPVSGTPRASGYQTASKAVVTKTKPAASEASTQNDEYYLYIRGTLEKMAPVRITGSPRQVSQNAGPHNAAPVLTQATVGGSPLGPFISVARGHSRE